MILDNGVHDDIAPLKGTNHRVLFQNEHGNINMGVWFNDPDIEMYDIFWFHNIAVEIKRFLRSNEGLVSVDEELGIKSCYVELQRIGIDSSERITVLPSLV